MRTSASSRWSTSVGCSTSPSCRPRRSWRPNVKSASIKSTSNRWRKDLTVAQQAILDNLLHDDLLRYGYGDSRPQEVRQPVGR